MDPEDVNDGEYGCTVTTGGNTVSEFNFDFDICNEAEAESKGGHRAGSAEEFEWNIMTCVGPGLEVGEAVWKE
jgi:hypothetical protein